MINKKIHTITNNRRAYYEYSIEDTFEAGIILQGWEVKSLRLGGQVQISNSYVLLHNGNAYLVGTHFQPTPNVSNHITCNPIREKKLLLKQRELKILYGKVKHKRYTVIALSLYWKIIWCKVLIGIAKGKKQYDKRVHIKNREWKIDKERFIKNKMI
ncbi:MAG: SsrA-binding protein SmpB [Candidatus Dasytiphilus stammeri]